MKTNQFIKRQGHYMRFITGTVYIFDIHIYIYELSHICRILIKT